MEYEEIHSTFISLVDEIWDSEVTEDPCMVSSKAGDLLRKEYTSEECEEYFMNYDFNIYDYLGVEFDDYF